MVKIIANKPKPFEKLIYQGEYFGEGALLSNPSIRSASVIAFTKVELLILEKHDFSFVFGGGETRGGSTVLNKLLKIIDVRKSPA